MVEDHVWLHPTKDHFFPKSSGPGKDRPQNIVWSCRSCNQIKGNMHPAFWEVVMKVLPNWWELAKLPGPRGVQLMVKLQNQGIEFPTLPDEIRYY